MGHETIVLNKIKANFIDNHLAFVYEDVCKEKTWNLNAEGKLGMTFDKLGRWWNHETEIDIVGIDTNGQDILFGECKYYTNKPMDTKVLYQLIEKAKSVDWKNETRKEHYILFSITGYSKELQELAKNRQDVLLG